MGERGFTIQVPSSSQWARERERGNDLKVLIPTPLRSYTSAREVEADGATVAEALADLERRYPGIRFRMIDEQDRMRAHMRFFVNGEQVFDMGRPLVPSDSIQIVQALSGG
jgi:molybdopterin converting factor small subunit